MTKAELEKDFLGQEAELIFDRKSLHMTIIISIIVLVLALAGAWSLRRSIIVGLEKNSIIRTIGESGNNQPSITAGADGQLKLTEEQLTENLQKSGFSLSKIKATIKPDGVYIAAKAGNNFFSLPVDAKIIPSVNDGKPEFKIASMESRGIVAPQKISAPVEKELNNFFRDSLKFPDHFVLTNILLNKGFMIFDGEISR